MIFNSVTFLVFLSLVLLLFWLLPHRARLWMIFSSSLMFYGFWRPEFVVLMLLSAGTDYVAARQIEAHSNQRMRRAWLIGSLTINLGLLLYFKYLLFFIDNAVIMLRFLGWEVQVPALTIILPLGISFYTFQTISYTVDVYRRFIPAEKDFLLYGCFVTFFPQLVAGPILRGSDLLNQLGCKPVFRLETFSSGLRRVLLGLFLKVVVADNIAPIVDEGFDGRVDAMSAIDVLTLAFLFGFQIYCDFSAYSHIALGSARMMGIVLPENFHFPYMARSPREFWQRWHISLSSWVRDYLYLPLLGVKVDGRSIGGLGAAARDRGDFGRHPIVVLYLTWGIMGFWHGANWTFVLWGLYHANMIFLYRATVAIRGRLPIGLRHWGGWAATLMLVMLSWVPFRARTVEDALGMYAKLASLDNYLWLGMRENTYLIAAVMLISFLFVWLGHRYYAKLRGQAASLFLVLECVAMGIVGSLVFVFLRPINQFIYFQF